MSRAANNKPPPLPGGTKITSGRLLFSGLFFGLSVSECEKFVKADDRSPLQFKIRTGHRKGLGVIFTVSAGVGEERHIPCYNVGNISCNRNESGVVPSDFEVRGKK